MVYSAEIIANSCTQPKCICTEAKNYIQNIEFAEGILSAIVWNINKSKFIFASFNLHRKYILLKISLKTYIFLAPNIASAGV